KQSFFTRLSLRWAAWQNHWRIKRISNQVRMHAARSSNKPKIVIFNASSRLSGLSQNAAFTILTGWGLRLAGAQVIYFACQAGMKPCVLGTSRDDYTRQPPCEKCIAQTKRLTKAFITQWFRYQPDSPLEQALENLTIGELSEFQYSGLEINAREDIPLGQLVLPALRWALRRYHLPNDDATRYLFRQYILSAYNVARNFAQLLEKEQPQVCLIFNGIMYPEATARWVAIHRGMRVVTQEVGFQPFSAFFTNGDATAYPISIPKTFELDERQNARLDAYLEKRFKGKFTMAGIQFWPQIQGLSEEFNQRAAQFKQIVPIFTNVVYDTSQVHANVLFRHMFHWLDHNLEIIRAHPETLFVIRAHPDEMRPGTAKQSRESVHDWVFANGVNKLSNVIFIDSQEYISSYELISRSKFLMVYNSSIGLEAALLGVLVLCAGKARYTQYPTVLFPKSIEDYDELAQALLEVEKIEFPETFRRNARRFLYYQLYRVSLPFGKYLEVGPRPGFVQLKDFSWKALLPEYSPTMRTIIKGMFEDEAFQIDENEEWQVYGSD
ncbi:MAG: hypothetical protein ACPL3P_09555, partial [Anaerolineales bacterium]